MRTRPCLHRAGLLGLLPFICLALHAAQAGSATWNLSPSSGDWSTAANWTPNTVPNGPADVATFDQSNITAVSLSAETEVNGITFDPGASAFTITVPTTLILTVSGTGIINNSGIGQDFVAQGGEDGTTAIEFRGNATAGDLTVFRNRGGIFGHGETNFFDDSTAGTATFINSGNGSDGRTQFFDRSSAGGGTFSNLGNGANTIFMDDSTAADGTFIVKGNTFALPGQMSFFGNSDAGNGNFTLTGGGCFISFFETTSAANGIFTINDASVNFGGDSTAGNATLIANDGGSISFGEGSSGGTARIELFGSGILAFKNHDAPGLTIGSLEGTGFVGIGGRDLTVGSNDLDTKFDGVVQGKTGSLVKIGAGTLTLTGANTYDGGTIISSGVLLVSNRQGSGTGSGAVSVDAGTLGGRGVIAGAVTVGTNSGVQAFLAPSKGAQKPATLTIQKALTLNGDSTYLYQLNTNRAVSDEVIANGVTIDDGAKFSFRPRGDNALTLGQVFTAINNTAATSIAGAFQNLPEGKIITVNGSKLQATYTGGDGNDLTLTVVP